MTEASPLFPKTKLDLLRRALNAPVTAAGLAEATGMHPTVVRRHMEQLSAAGLVEARSQRTGRGRPHLVYSPTREGRELLYARYDLVLETVTRVLSGPASGDLGRKAFAEAARVLARDAGAPKSMEATVPFLQDLGFQPEIRSQNGTKLLISHNCPVLQVAERYPVLICDVFHTSLAGSLLGTNKVEMGPTISRGATECMHLIKSPHGRPGHPSVDSGVRATKVGRR